MIGGIQQWDPHEEKFQTQLENNQSKIRGHIVSYLKIMYYLTMTLDLLGEDLLEVVVDPLVVAMDLLMVVDHMEGEDLKEKIMYLLEDLGWDLF
jgi:hypothetical protein